MEPELQPGDLVEYVLPQPDGVDPMNLPPPARITAVVLRTEGEAVHIKYLGGAEFPTVPRSRLIFRQRGGSY